MVKEFNSFIKQISLGNKEKSFQINPLLEVLDNSGYIRACLTTPNCNLSLFGGLSPSRESKLSSDFFGKYCLSANPIVSLVCRNKKMLHLVLLDFK